MNNYNQLLLKAVKMAYGKRHYDLDTTVPFGFDVVIGWFIVGYDTLEELEAEYSDEDILAMYKSYNS